MGSISSNGRTGLRRLLYVNSSGKRKAIHLGRVTKKDALRINTYVEKLLSARITQQPIDSDTAQWVAAIGDKLARKLADHGLIDPRAAATLEDFVDAYIAGRSDLKPRTIQKLKHTKRYLVEFFGAEQPLRDITPGHADDWRIDLISKGLSENTIRKHSQIAKQFMHAALRKKLIEANPFADLKSTTLANPERFYFVTRDEADAVLDACPDTQWKLVFALSRFGGLRCPSEHLALTWDDVDWDRDRMTIRSSKTEHHASRGIRSVPLFPELKPLLRQGLAERSPGERYVVTITRDSAVNWRTGLKRIIESAGLEPWPKVFQNLRSTRETELVRDYPVHVVCSWIGNTEVIAMKHYLQVTDDDFRKAAHDPAQSGATHSVLDGPEDSDIPRGAQNTLASRNKEEEPAEALCMALAT